eukprot:s540_g19.t1
MAKRLPLGFHGSLAQESAGPAACFETAALRDICRLKIQHFHFNACVEYSMTFANVRYGSMSPKALGHCPARIPFGSQSRRIAKIGIAMRGMKCRAKKLRIVHQASWQSGGAPILASPRNALLLTSLAGARQKRESLPTVSRVWATSKANEYSPRLGPFAVNFGSSRDLVTRASLDWSLILIGLREAADVLFLSEKMFGKFR